MSQNNNAIVNKRCLHPSGSLVYLGLQQTDPDDLSKSVSLFNCTTCKTTVVAPVTA